MERIQSKVVVACMPVWLTGRWIDGCCMRRLDTLGRVPLRGGFVEAGHGRDVIAGCGLHACLRWDFMIDKWMDGRFMLQVDVPVYKDRCMVQCKVLT